MGRFLMSSAIPSTTCLTIIKSRMEFFHKGVSDFKACLDKFFEDPAKRCANHFCLFCQKICFSNMKIKNEMVSFHACWTSVSGPLFKLAVRLPESGASKNRDYCHNYGPYFPLFFVK